MPNDTGDSGGFDQPREETKGLGGWEAGTPEKVEPEEFFDDVSEADPSEPAQDPSDDVQR